MRIRIFFSYFFLSISALCACKDAIHFFNVGQGHCALVTRNGNYQTSQPYVPLLIDAGSDKGSPREAGSGFLWEKTGKGTMADKVAKIIKTAWGIPERAPPGPRRTYRLNVIITHPDADHKNLLPDIFSKLRSIANKIKAHTDFHVLLGGQEAQYTDYIPKLNPITPHYSQVLAPNGVWYSQTHNNIPEAFRRSGCIREIFLPRGEPGLEPGKRNTWSIITRVSVGTPVLSALFTGDAEAGVQDQILRILNTAETARAQAMTPPQVLTQQDLDTHAQGILQSDILLFPHHGAASLREKFRRSVDPRAVVIGSYPTTHCHPKGRPLLKLLQDRDQHVLRFWDKATKPHGLIYHSPSGESHAEIMDLFANKKRLFLEVPGSAAGRSWHLAWTDAPIFTLWTTGELEFTPIEGPASPRFVDAPDGILTHFAMESPRSLLPLAEQGRLALSDQYRDCIDDALAAVPTLQARRLSRTLIDQAVVLGYTTGWLATDESDLTWGWICDAATQHLQSAANPENLKALSNCIFSHAFKLQGTLADRALFLKAAADPLILIADLATRATDYDALLSTCVPEPRTDPLRRAVNDHLPLGSDSWGDLIRISGDLNAAGGIPNPAEILENCMCVYRSCKMMVSDPAAYPDAWPPGAPRLRELVENYQAQLEDGEVTFPLRDLCHTIGQAYGLPCLSTLSIHDPCTEWERVAPFLQKKKQETHTTLLVFMPMLPSLPAHFHTGDHIMKAFLDDDFSPTAMQDFMKLSLIDKAGRVRLENCPDRIAYLKQLKG